VKEDGGDLFEDFVFGGRMRTIFPEDWNLIEKILSMSHPQLEESQMRRWTLSDQTRKLESPKKSRMPNSKSFEFK
jgi:hypothetical protein